MLGFNIFASRKHQADTPVGGRKLFCPVLSDPLDLIDSVELIDEVTYKSGAS